MMTPEQFEAVKKRLADGSDDHVDHMIMVEEYELLLQKFDNYIHADPPSMSVPGGKLLPINSTGMRECVDKWAAWRRFAKDAVDTLTDLAPDDEDTIAIVEEFEERWEDE